MPEAFLKDIQKLEVRLKRFLENENKFINELKNSLKKFNELNDKIDKLKIEFKNESFKEFIKVKMETMNAFNEMLKKESELEHEKSHFLESYGSLLLILEEETKNLLSYLMQTFHE
ncbi:MAG: hypothetical protein QW589_02935 [Candidatus Bathyarchaeia archaeon]